MSRNPSPLRCGVKVTHSAHQWNHDPTDTIFACDGISDGDTPIIRSLSEINGGATNLLAKLHPDEPVFVIRAQDILAPQAIALYAELARKVGLDELAQGVEARAVQVMQWQARNAKLVKSPD